MENNKQERPSSEIDPAGKGPAEEPFQEDVPAEIAHPAALDHDPEGKAVELTGSPAYKTIIRVFALVFAVFGILSNSFMQMELMKKGGVFLAFILALCFQLYPTKIKGKRLFWLDVVLSLLGFACGLYTFLVTERFQSSTLQMTTLDLVMSVLAFCLVILATKKAVGTALAVLPIIFALYALYGHLIPGAFGHFGVKPARFFMRMYMVSEGIYGLTTQTASSYIFLFILFGGLLNESGVGEFFTDLANKIAGRSAGGPAKVAVISSGLMGMISGSAAANVATTGAFTIPMMKREGFSKKFSGAVEAVASTGGLIMPPIMGSAAFLMVQYLGLPYTRIMGAAIIPALLYYLSCFICVHFEAHRIGHHGHPEDQIPPIEDLKHRIFLLMPVISIIAAMLIGYTPIFAALIGMVFTVLAGVIQQKERRMRFRQILNGLINGANSALTACIACIAAGIIVGVCTITGVGQVLTYNIVALSGNNLLFALILTALACFLLSMGLPASACYILVATIVAPALVTMGVAPIAAHMFVFYFASLSNITPPVAIASYTAAGISGAKPFEVAWQAMRIALPGFIIPFLFAYNPILVLENATFLPAAIAIITSVIGVVFMAIASVGYNFSKIGWGYRVPYIIGANLLIIPENITDVIGVVIIGVTVAIEYMRFKQGRNAAAA